MRSLRIPQPKPSEPVPSLRVDGDGCWRIFPAGSLVAGPGEWLTFLPWILIDNGIDRVVYGAVVGVVGDVGINAAEQPPGVTADLFIPYLLAEVRMRSVIGADGGMSVQVIKTDGGPLDFRPRATPPRRQ